MPPYIVEGNGKVVLPFHKPYKYSRSSLPAKTTQNRYTHVHSTNDAKEETFLRESKELFYDLRKMVKKGQHFLARWSDTNLPHGFEDFIRDVITMPPREHRELPAARRALAEKGLEWLEKHPEPMVETINTLPQQGPLEIFLNGQHQLVEQVYLEEASHLFDNAKQLAYTRIDFLHDSDEALVTRMKEGETVYLAHRGEKPLEIVRTAVTPVPGLLLPVEDKAPNPSLGNASAIPAPTYAKQRDSEKLVGPHEEAPILRTAVATRPIEMQSKAPVNVDEVIQVSSFRRVSGDIFPTSCTRADASEEDYDVRFV